MIVNWMRRRGTAGRSAAFAVMAFMVVQLLAAPVYALPSGAETVHGEAAFLVSDNTLTVSQASDRLIVNWDAFGIDAGERVVFDQPGAAAIALNRVIGDDPSAIYGQLTANGRVFLLNPHGVLFGADAQVDVGGLVASTLGLHNDDFLAGTYRFTSSDPLSHGGIVVNEGQLTTGNGGSIALLGTTVDNRGAIHTPEGSAVLAAGGDMTLSLDDDGLLSIVIDEAALGAQVANGGLIVADGGRVFLTADAKDALFETVVSHTGTIRARTLEARGGEIVLLGGMDGGTVVVDGTLDASAPDGGNGGFIETSGAHVRVTDGAKVTTAASDGATGVWLIDPTDYVIAEVDPDDGRSFMKASTLATNLTSTSVTIETLDAGEDAGDIFVNDAVSWNSDHSLTLKAHRNVEINANVTNDGEGDVIVRADKGGSGTGTVLFDGGVINTGGDVTLFYNPTNFKTPSNFADHVTAGGDFKAYMLVNNVTDLQNIDTNVAGHYALGRDIDASVTREWNGDQGFRPLGPTSAPFNGSFNGQGHVIDGLFINRTGYVGLFGITNAGSVIRDVGLTNVDVQGSGDSVGGLVGLNRGTVIESYVTGSVSGRHYVGGLVGDNEGTVSRSYATATVSGSSGIGGLVGLNAGSVGRSYATGAVSGDAPVGGLVGFHSHGTVSESYATGAVTGTIAGGLVGHSQNANSVKNSYWDISTTGISEGCQGRGCPDATGIGGVGGDDPFTEATYDDWDFDDTWYMIDGETRPFLQMEYSTDIRNAHQLQLMRMNVNANYTLMTDIDLGAALTKNGGMWGEAGFVPIAPFNGSFNGHGHVIDGLFINRTADVGLFGRINAGRVVRDVGLTNVDVQGSGDRVGGLAGHNSGTVIESYVTGSVNGNSFVGGLVGLSTGAVSRSYATATANGSSSVGGLVGLNEGSVGRSYAMGVVTGDGAVGGLVGYHKKGTVSESYATGAVTGNSSVGGLVGYSHSGNSVKTSYWDIVTTGITEGCQGNGCPDAVGIGGEGGLDPFTQATYTDWDFTAHFAIDEGISYPYLRWRFPQGPSVVSGTVSGVEGGNDRLGVGLTVEGTVVGTTTTGADGSYYMAVDPLNPGDAAVVWLDDARGNTLSVLDAQGHGTAFDIHSDVVRVMTDRASLSATSTHLLDAARGALNNDRILYSVAAGNVLSLAPGASLSANATGGDFDIDQSVSTSKGGSIEVHLTYGSLTVSKDLNADGTVTLVSPTDLTISAGATVKSGANGNAIVLSADGDFRNHAGSGALALTGDGRWLVYSTDPDSSDFNGLDSENSALWNATYATLGPSSVTVAGNRYVFQLQPTLTFTSKDFEKTYGTAITLDEAYTVSGYHPGVTGAFVADTADTAFGGAPHLSSDGAAAGANASHSGYEVTIAAGDLASTVGYAFAFVSDGRLSVAPARLTITAVNHDKSYDGTTDSDGMPIVTGTLFAGDTLGGLVQAFDAKHAGARSLIVTGYTLSDGNDGNNYEVTLVQGSGTISKAPLTITAGDHSRTYDGTTDSDGMPIVTGTLFAGDTLDGLVQAFDAKHAGARSLIVTGYTLSDGNDGNNYDVTLAPGSGTINPKTLNAVLIGTVQKTYDGTTHVTLTAANYSLIGALSEDEVELNGFGTYDTKNVGESKTVTVNGLGLVGKHAANYMLDEDSVSAAIGVITRAELVVRARDIRRLIGEENPAFDVSYHGFATGDTPAVLSGELSFITDAASDSRPGLYDIYPLGLSASNYTIIYQPGTLAIVSTPIVSGVPDDAYQMAVWYAQSAFQTDFETNDADEGDALEVID